MALDTSTYENGHGWTTQSLDINAVLRKYDNEEREARMPHMDVEDVPVLGLLTQTVIRSPLVHWILPVRLRNQDSNDVAFIGVMYLFPLLADFARFLSSLSLRTTQFESQNALSQFRACCGRAGCWLHCNA
jgi:hypothetical protein